MATSNNHYSILNVQGLGLTIFSVAFFLFDSFRKSVGLAPPYKFGMASVNNLWFDVGQVCDAVVLGYCSVCGG